MSKVYVVQEPPQVLQAHGQGRRPKFDISPAQKWGPLKYLLEWSEIADLTPEDIKQLLEQRLRDFTAEDYLLITGSPVAMTIAACIAARRAGGTIKMITHYPRTGYTMVTFTP